MHIFVNRNGAVGAGFFVEVFFNEKNGAEGAENFLGCPHRGPQGATGFKAEKRGPQGLVPQSFKTLSQALILTLNKERGRPEEV